MLSLLFMFFYLLAGVAVITFLLPRVRVIQRVYLGLCFGLGMMMWLPAICAFFLSFSLAGHLCSMALCALIVLAAYLFRDKRAPAGMQPEDKTLFKSILMFALPMTVLASYLLWTHVIEPAPDGSLHVGQSTYGDLNLHLAIITGLRDAKFPADYSIFPGERLAYPFLTDSLSTSMMLFGMGLRAAVLVPSCLMMLLIFSGYMILVTRITKTAGGARLAFLLFFINGGLGFLYVFDMIGVRVGSYGANQLQSGVGLAERLQNVLYGWYQTPTNHAEFTTYNLRWSNVICDMLIPQRTTMGGWCMVLACIYLLYDTMVPQRVELQEEDSLSLRPYALRRLLLLGVMAGALPMIHTHSFAALGLLSVGWMVYDLVFAGRERLARLWMWLFFGALTVLIALPQLLIWTFGQAGASDHFLSFHFNWVNNASSAGLRDGYLWFYLKNIGLPFALILLSLLDRNPKRRFLASGAFVIFLLAELIQFQPNEYDNNKLFYVWYMLMTPLAAEYALELFARLKGTRARLPIAAVTLFIFFASGTMSIACECVSDYQLFSKQDVEAAAFIEENVPKDAVFMTWTQHINPVSSLAGRTIVCGPDLWLYYHGFTTAQRHSEISAFYADPLSNQEILEKYGAQYIFVSSYERSGLQVNLDALEEGFTRVFTSSDDAIRIYQVEP